MGSDGTTAIPKLNGTVTMKSPTCTSSPQINRIRSTIRYRRELHTTKRTTEELKQVTKDHNDDRVQNSFTSTGQQNGSGLFSLERCNMEYNNRGKKKKKHEMLPKTTALVGILEATRKVHMLILFLNSPLEIGQIKSLRFEHSHSLKKMVRIFTI